MEDEVDAGEIISILLSSPFSFLENAYCAWKFEKVEETMEVEEIEEFHEEKFRRIKFLVAKVENCMN